MTPNGRQHVWRPYTQMQTARAPLEVVGAEGVRLHLADGRTLIDGIASWWTMCHGYNHPWIRQAVAAQLEQLPHVMFGGLTHAPAERLAQRLAALLPGDLDHVFFSDSGSVAIEVALKMAIQYWRNRGADGRDRFLAFTDGYHGDTLGAMSVTDPVGGMHRRLAAYIPQQVFAPPPVSDEDAATLDRLLQEYGPRLAGVIVEPLVQGAGGMRMHAPAVLARLAELCARHGQLLILDEIMTGFGRTGTMFACEQAGVVPDIICLSKALTGGTLSLAATVARSHVFEAFLSDRADHALMHGPTFMANATACAAANASLDLFERAPRLAQVAEIEQVLRAGLAPCRALPGVVDVRVKGAIGVVQLDHAIDGSALRAAFIERGVWLRPFGDIVYLTPSFTIDVADLELLCAAVCDVVALREPGRALETQQSAPDL